MNARQNSEFLHQEAKRLGFAQVGVAKAERLDDVALHLERWLNKGAHGKMHYMENHFEKRVDPRKLVPGAKSVISLLFNYYTDRKQEDIEAPKISMYAYGEDYHFVVKRKLKALLAILQTKIGQFTGRVFIDSAPIMEREWAARSGLGWTGRNTLSIHPQKGSYFFLAEIILDVEFEYDHPIKDHCGTCTKCIEACPTDAISPTGYVLDGSKCISYLTIELKGAIPKEFQGKMDNWIFGCDICQQVCPWNRFSYQHEESCFEPAEEMMSMKNQDWQELTDEIFQDLFKKSAVKRTKFTGLKRNINFLNS